MLRCSDQRKIGGNDKLEQCQGRSIIKNLSQIDLTRMVDEANKTCLKGNGTWVLNRIDETVVIKLKYEAIYEMFHILNCGF